MPAAASRTLTVLGILAAAEGPLTATQLAEATGINRASMVRLLSSLVEEGGVEMDESGGFTTTLMLWSIGAGTLNKLAVREVAFPYLSELCSRIPAHLGLSVAEYPFAVGVESLRWVSGRTLSKLAANKFHLLSFAAGRIIAAYETEERQKALFDIPFPNPAERPKRDRDDLLRDLAVARERGYSTIDREHGSTSGFAVPLFDATNRPTGSVAFARQGELDMNYVSQYLPMAQEVAERISWELGWRAGEAARLS